MPVASWNVIVLSAVGSVMAKVVSKSLAVAPSKTNGLAPAIVPLNVAIPVTVKAVAVKEAIVPTLVNDEATTADPRVVAFRTEAPAI